MNTPTQAMTQTEQELLQAMVDVIVREAEKMLKMAYKHYRALTGMGNNEIFDEEVFGFHIQQAVEKAFKAWLCALTGQYPFTHDLTRLLILLENVGIDMEKYWPLTQYNIFAVQARYEEGLLLPDEPLDRPGLTADLQALLEHVQQIIEKT